MKKKFVFGLIIVLVLAVASFPIQEVNANANTPENFEIYGPPAFQVSPGGGYFVGSDLYTTPPVSLIIFNNINEICLLQHGSTEIYEPYSYFILTIYEDVDTFRVIDFQYWKDQLSPDDGAYNLCWDRSAIPDEDFKIFLPMIQK